MTSFSKILFVLVLAELLNLPAGSVPSDTSKKEQCPGYDGELVIPGLTGEVTVYRDGKGMPHIYAGNEPDLYLAAGFISAQERLWQMDLIRRSATGRLSEIFGKSFIQADIFARFLRIKEKSRIVIEKEDPEILKCMQAYADGVNVFIRSAGRKLPVEFRILSYEPEEWDLQDIANIIGFLGWNLASRNLTTELFNYQLVKKLGTEKASHLISDGKTFTDLVYPDFKISDTLINDVQSIISSSRRIAELGITPFSGSNNWAVSGSRTGTGKPFLSNDTHLSLTTPGIWMQMHQVIPGILNVTGAMIPGQPFVVIGHNEKIAWGATNLMVDDIDLFAEKINPENRDQYYFNGEWKNMENKSEIIKVRKGDDDTLKMRLTHRGPILSGLKEIDDISLSMRWSGYDYSDEIKAVYLLNRAGSWYDFRTGLKEFRTVNQNFAYADNDGNIGLSAGGGIPIRKGPGIMIRNGETDEYDWKGYVPFDELPYSFNPAKGYVSSANNKTVTDDYPYYISSQYAMPYRITRIREMLDEKEIFKPDDFTKMINDQHSGLAELMVPFILRLNSRRDDLTPSEATALDSVNSWNYDMNVNLISPSIFEFFRISFRKNLIADELDELFDMKYYMPVELYLYRLLRNGPDEWVDNINTPEKETIDDIVMQSFKDCIGSLTDIYGNNLKKWEWGNIHTITFKHPLGSKKILDLLFNLNSETYGIGGSDHTVSAFFSFNNEFKVDYGTSQKFIFNTAEWDESLTALPGGESGMPGSEYYLSQVRTFIDGRFYKDAFSEYAVKASACHKMVLKPVD